MISKTKYLFPLILFISLVGAAAEPNYAYDKDDWDISTREYTFKVIEMYFSYVEALSYCARNGGFLAFPTSEFTLDIMKLLMRKHYPLNFWIGLHSFDGSDPNNYTIPWNSLQYTDKYVPDWDKKEPSCNYPENPELCVVAESERDYKWNNLSCDRNYDKRTIFICMRKR